jgi:hypothetical protein
MGKIEQEVYPRAHEHDINKEVHVVANTSIALMYKNDPEYSKSPSQPA